MKYNSKHRSLLEAVESMAPLDVLPWRIDERDARRYKNRLSKQFGKTRRTLSAGGMIYIVRLT